LRGAPPGLPFRFDEAKIQSGLNFTLSTSLGDLDLLGEITGVAQMKIYCLTHYSFNFSTLNVCVWGWSD
jgi:hypothetical protein